MVWYVRALALVLILLHIVAPFLPEKHSWGIFPYTYLPRPLQWAAAALGLTLCIGPINAAMRRALTWLNVRRPARGRRRLWYAVASLLIAIPFWAGRIVHTRWGDAYILVNAIPHPDVRLTYTWQAPFDLYLHAKAWSAANRLWGWDAMQVYHVVSLCAGIVFIFLLLCMADDLGRNRAERAALAGLVGTLGLMQFFFGYVENYVLMTVGALLYLWLGMRNASGRSRLVWPAVALALTNGFHPSTILGLNISLLWLSAREWLRASTTRLAVSLQTIMPFLVVFAAVVLLLQSGGHGFEALFGSDAPGGGDGSWLVPFSKPDSRWEHYTMVSWGHLLDFLNEQILVAPFSLALVIGLLISTRGRAVLCSPDCAFLAICAAGYLLLTMIWNPDYGGRRDWDLFAPAALPLTLLASYLLIGVDRIDRQETGQSRLGEIVLIVAGVSGIFTAAWIYSNTLPWSW